VCVLFAWPGTLRLTVLVSWMTVYVMYLFSGLRMRCVQSHSDGSHAEANALCPACALAQVRHTMSCVLLVLHVYVPDPFPVALQLPTVAVCPFSSLVAGTRHSRTTSALLQILQRSVAYPDIQLL